MWARAPRTPHAPPLGRLANRARIAGRALGSLKRVSPLAARRWMRRLRRHAAGLLLVLALAAAIVVHHGAISLDGVHHDGTAAAVEMCLGVFTAVGAAVAAIALGVLALGRWRTPLALLPVGALRRAGTRAPEARAGPPPLAQLCVWRR